MKSKAWFLGWIVCLIGAGLIASGAVSLVQQLQSDGEIVLLPAMDPSDVSPNDAADVRSDAADRPAQIDATTVKIASLDADAADTVNAAPAIQAATPDPTATGAPNAALAPDETAVVQQLLAKFPMPEQIWIDKIKVRARIEPVGPGKRVNNEAVEWGAPKNKNVGWHDYSARLGEGKNIVLNGHNNIYGAVFRNLYTLAPGDEIRLGAGDKTYVYKVEQVLRLLEKGQPLAVRLKNAEYIQPMNDDRLTIVSCWPPTNNTHRVIVIARPKSPSN
jgi:sortase A